MHQLGTDRGFIVFSSAEPALRFHATNRIDALRDRPVDGSHRARLLATMRERMLAEPKGHAG